MHLAEVLKPQDIGRAIDHARRHNRRCRRRQGAERKPSGICGALRCLGRVWTPGCGLPCAFVLDGTNSWLGIQVAGRVLYFGVATTDGPAVDEGPARLKPSEQLELAAQLGDVRDHVRSELRALSPAGVGILRTTKFSQWQYKDAFPKFSLETAAILACVDEGIPARLVTAEEAASAVPAARASLPAQALKTWGVDPRPPYWNERAWALATAAALASKAGG
jgi:hypothetical protein